MQTFNVGDLVQFIPENFDDITWSYRYEGVGYIEEITDWSVKTNSIKGLKVYKIFCGKIIRQQMKNFAEIELKDIVLEFTDKDMQKVCKKLNK